MDSVLGITVKHVSVCQDSSRIDSGGDGCSYYTQWSNDCGIYDFSDFTAAIDCCACKTADTIAEETEVTCLN